MPALYQRMKNPEGDLRDLALRAGIGSYVAPMAIQFMNFLPRTCDPYAAGVQELVRGLQRLLNEQGAKLVVDGGLGNRTVQALARFAGPRWYDKSWAQLYGDILAGQVWEGFERNDRSTAEELARLREMQTGLGSMTGDVVGAVLDRPVLLAAGAVGLWWWFKHGRRR